MKHKRLRHFAAFGLFLSVLVVGAATGLAERYALVMGNSAYQHAGYLKNPGNDADLMTSTLRQVGFHVYSYKDLTVEKMQDAIREFRGHLGTDDTAVVYYSGHGLQYKGENYLAPVDYNVKYEYELQRSAVSLTEIENMLSSAHASPKLIFLDCCRDTHEFRSLEKGAAEGMSKVDPDENTLVSFATKQGKTAQDNPESSNSNYTHYLAQELVQPGVTVEETMKAVHRDVHTASKGEQLPCVYSSLSVNFCFVEDGSGHSTPPSPPTSTPTYATTSTPAPTYRPTPVSTPPPSSLPDGLEAFARTVWTHQWEADADTWADDFASQSSYCYYHDGNASASRSFIREDRRKLLGRFPSRHYDLVGDINVTASSSTEAEVILKYKYRYSGEKNASGNSRVRYTAKLIGNRWQITRYEESVSRN